jgi:hypothetical protein
MTADVGRLWATTDGYLMLSVTVFKGNPKMVEKWSIPQLWGMFLALA